MEYKLSENGDDFEKIFWPILCQDFPNYEILWNNFIIPLTQRGTSGGIHLKPDLNPILESIAMAHYSTFYHLGMAASLQRQGFPHSEDILFHLSASSEMVDRFLLTLVKLDSVVSGRKLPDPLQEEKVVELVQDYLEKKYHKYYKRFLNKGQSVHILLHNVDELSEGFCRGLGVQALKDYKEWCKVVNQVRHYRNTLTHNPRLGMLVADGDIFYVPKEIKLSEYEYWSSVYKRSNSSDFVPLTDLLSSFSTRLVSKTNMLWNHLIAFLSEVSTTESYKNLTNEQVDDATGITILDVDKPEEQSNTPTSASGTFSYDR